MKIIIIIIMTELLIGKRNSIEKLFGFFFFCHWDEHSVIAATNSGVSQATTSRSLALPSKTINIKYDRITIPVRTFSSALHFWKERSSCKRIKREAQQKSYFLMSYWYFKPCCSRVLDRASDILRLKKKRI